MPRTTTSSAAARSSQTRAPVLAVLVCHDGQQWLRPALSALRNLTPRPTRLIAVDTGSTDATPDLLTAADDVVNAVVTMSRDTGFGAAVAAGLEQAAELWPDADQPWIWLLHDDSAPEPGCLGALLAVADVSSSAALLGPLTLDWDDPRLVTGAGLSTDAAGNVQTGIGAVELDLGQFEQNTEVLAVSSAGALVKREVWDELGGYDPALTLARDDLDFGWRANQADHVVLCVPGARLRHAAAMASGARKPDPELGRFRALDRAHGARTYLANSSTLAYVVGLPRLIVLCTLRGLGFLLVRRVGRARAEWGAAGYLMSGRAGLRSARRSRRLSRVLAARGVRGLLTNRITRLRNGLRAGIAALVRRRVQDDAAFGRLPAERSEWVAPPKPLERAVAPETTDETPETPAPADAPAAPVTPARPSGGLRRPSRAVAVPVPVRPKSRRRPAPAPRSASSPSRGETTMQLPTVTGRRGELVMVEVDRGRLIRETLLAPPVLLLLATTILAAVVNHGRLGLDLAGGRLLPAEGMSDTWTSYVEAWLPVGGGSAAPSPATLSIIGVLGLPFWSPAAAASLLMLLAMPLAAFSAYFATRSVGVRREIRALVAGAYALLPAGTAAVAQGRLDVVVAHILLPPILAGTAAVLRGAADRRAGGWLSTACGTALCVAVVSAFAPVLHLLVLAVALIGFVVAPAPRAVTLRRGAALFMIVLLPLGMLLPWPAVVVQRPAVLVHGLGGIVPEDWPGWGDILTLDPGGPGAAPILGILVIVAAAAAAVLRPSLSMVPALAVVVLGMGTAVLIGNIDKAPMVGGDPRPGFTGGPLLFASCGLLLMILLACRPMAVAAAIEPPAREKVTVGAGPTGEGPGAQSAPAVGGRTRAAFYVAAGLALAAMAAGAVLDGDDGPLEDDGPGLAALAAPSQDQLERNDTWVLVVGDATEPVRMTRGREPRFGDDSVVPLRTTAVRLKRAADALRAGQPGETSAAIADVAASGVEFIVLPTPQQGAAALASSGGLAAEAPPTSDGRPVLRVLRPVPGAELLGPALAKEARSGSSPPTDPDTKGVLVEADPPELAAQVAPGADGRLLVLAANDEPGWEAKIDGEGVPVVRAWGHQVAVEVPGGEVAVTIDRSETTRTILLVLQAAIVLLALGTAVPSRVHRDD